MPNSKKGNRSVQRSKHAIEMAFLQLCTKKDISKITINELAEEANVSRGTVYAHYHDIYDVQDTVFQHIAIRFTEKVILSLYKKEAGEDYPYTVIFSAIQTLRKNPEMAKSFLSNPKIVYSCRNIVAGTIAEHIDLDGNDSLRLVMCYGVSGMVIDTLTAWLMEGTDVPPAELARTLANCISGMSALLPTRPKVNSTPILPNQKIRSCPFGTA